MSPVGHLIDDIAADRDGSAEVHGDPRFVQIVKHGAPARVRLAVKAVVWTQLFRMSLILGGEGGVHALRGKIGQPIGDVVARNATGAGMRGGVPSGTSTNCPLMPISKREMASELLS